MSEERVAYQRWEAYLKMTTETHVFAIVSYSIQSFLYIRVEPPSFSYK